MSGRLWRSAAGKRRRNWTTRKRRRRSKSAGKKSGPEGGRAMLASAALPEIQHIRPHVSPGLQARAALHLVIRAALAHRGRDGVLVVRLVLGGNRQTRLEVG